VLSRPVGELPPFEGTEGIEFTRPPVDTTPDGEDEDDDGDDDEDADVDGGDGT
jgi:hypothetical protein